MKNNILIFLLFIFLSSKTVLANNLRSGFVYLNDVDPSIIISLKYHCYNNITQKPIKGCTSNRAVLTKEAAEALRNVQEDLVMQGYTLIVYDAYHPKKAYDILQNWLNTSTSNDVKNIYHPNMDKQKIKEIGYIKTKNNHVRGSTVDVTIISLKDKLHNSCKHKKRSYKNQKNIIYMDDGSLDMGTSHDLFDELSSFDHPNIPADVKNNRALLRTAMQNHGFIPDKNFWWQFTLVREPYIDSEFDFDI